MRRLRLVLLAALFGCLPRGLAAQGECSVVQNQSVSVTNRGTPQEISYVVRADIVCPNGRRIYADNATVFAATGVVDLRGNVNFSDPERTLTANQAQYDRVNQRLYASGDVRVRAVKTNSVLYTDNLTYEQATAGREARMLAQPGARRPHAVLRRARPDPASRLEARRSGGPDSTVVDADMIEVIGERFFHAVGNAVMTRDSLRASGNVIDYYTDTGALTVVQNAQVEGPGYRLNGDTVRAEVTQDTLRAVFARIDARLTTDEVSARAPAIDILLTAGQVDRMIAVVPEQLRAELQAHVEARAFRLAADSIDVQAPAQQLEQVIAVGRAFGEMLDTLPPLPLPEDAPVALANDWMRGDTLHAFFIANPRAATDTAADERVLEHLVAGGAPAAALYRQRPDVVPADSVPGAPEIGYVIANRIEVWLAEGEVSDVKAAGEVRGMYLQPRARASASAAAGPPEEAP